MPNVPALRGTQPNWVYWSTWWGFETAESGNPDSLYQAVYGDPATLTQNEVTLPACP
jgi:hypothetical protein